MPAEDTDYIHIFPKGNMAPSAQTVTVAVVDDDIVLGIYGPRNGYIAGIRLNQSEATQLLSALMKAVEGIKDANT